MITNDKKIEVHIHINGIAPLMDMLNITSNSNSPPKAITKGTEGEDMIHVSEEEEQISSSEEDPLWTVHQFAQYFQVSETSARQWIKKGLIPIIRISKRIRIRKSEILKLERKRGDR